MRERIIEMVRTNPNLPPLPEILFGLQKIQEYFNFLTLKDLSSSDKPLELIEEEEFKIAHPEV